MTRLNIVHLLAKQAALGMGPIGERLIEEGQQLFTRIQRPQRAPPGVEPAVQEQLQNALPGTDPETAPRPSAKPILLAAGALLALGGFLYFTGGPARPAKAKS